MFHIHKVNDTIGIGPDKLSADGESNAWLLHSIVQSLDAKYCNRILPGHGVVICTRDVLSVSDGTATTGLGQIWFNVVCNLIVYRPEVGQVIRGRIGRMTENGIQVHCHFFGHIWISKICLWDGAKFKAPTGESEGQWSGFEDADAGDGIQDEMQDVKESTYVKDGDLVSIKVTQIKFTKETVQPEWLKKSVHPISEELDEERGPFVILGSMNGPGLGPLEWWDPELAQEDE